MRELRGLLICLPLVVIFALISWASIWLWTLGFSEVLREAIRRTASAPPRKKCPAGPSPKAGQSRFKSPQQRSSQAEKPVISEQENCSPRSYRQFESPLLRQQVSDITAEDFCDSIVASLPTVSARSRPSWPLRELISRVFARSVSVVSQNATLPVAFSANDAGNCKGIYLDRLTELKMIITGIGWWLARNPRDHGDADAVALHRLHQRAEVAVARNHEPRQSGILKRKKT